MRLAVVVGHDNVRRGAIGRLWTPEGREIPGRVEVEANEVLARQIATAATLRGHEARVFLHLARGSSGLPALEDSRVVRSPSWTATAQATAREVNDWRPDLALELHFNAIPQRTADGLPMRAWSAAFCYHWPGSGRGEALGRAVSSACAEHLRTRDLGSEGRTHTWGGAELLMLRLLVCPTALVETHNGANPRDHGRFVAALDTPLLGAAIFRAAASVMPQEARHAV